MIFWVQGYVCKCTRMCLEMYLRTCAYSWWACVTSWHQACVQPDEGIRRPELKISETLWTPKLCRGRLAAIGQCFFFLDWHYFMFSLMQWTQKKHSHQQTIRSILAKRTFFSRRERKKRSRYLASDEKISPPAPPISMLTHDVVGQVAVEKKTLVFVLALATTQPNIEVGATGGT